MHLRALIVFFPLLCGGCASMFHGTWQTFSIATDPPGAVCNLWRNGEPIAALRATPGGVVIDKSKDVLTIVCDKPSYQTAYAQVEAQNDSLTGLDVILAPIALVFDEIIGAAHFYQPSIKLSMKPNGPAPRPAVKLQHF